MCYIISECDRTCIAQSHLGSTTSRDVMDRQTLQVIIIVRYTLPILVISTLTTLPGTSELSPQPIDRAQAVPGKRECSQSPPPLLGARRPHQPTAGLRMSSFCFHCPLSHTKRLAPPARGDSFQVLGHAGTLTIPPQPTPPPPPPSERSQFPSSGTCWHPDYLPTANLVPLGTWTCWAHWFTGGQGSCGAQMVHGHQLSPHPDNPPCH